MVKLISVVLFEKLQKLEAVVEDQDGKLRRVKVSWKTKGAKPVSAVWWRTVVAEVEEQRTQDLQKRTGRILF